MELGGHRRWPESASPAGKASLSCRGPESRGSQASSGLRPPAHPTAPGPSRGGVGSTGAFPARKLTSGASAASAWLGGVVLDICRRKSGSLCAQAGSRFLPNRLKKTSPLTVTEILWRITLCRHWDLANHSMFLLPVVFEDGRLMAVS